MNWLIIGVGDIARKRVIPAILAEPRSRLCGIVTRDPGKAAPFGVRAWTDLDEALAEPAIDAVYVATPVFLHAPQTIAALRAGKHVLCEKPVALDYAQACAMVTTARETGRTLGIAYYRRMYPKLRRARQLLAEGAIGRPVLAEINCLEWFADEDGQRAWLLDPARAGGGPLYDIGSHRIDTLNFLFGRPVNVAAQRSNVVHRFAVEDCATVLIEYESGVRGIVDVRWHCRFPRDEFRITGTEGELVLTPLSGAPLRHPGGVEDWPPHANLHYPAIEDFVTAVAEGRPPCAPGEEAIWTDWVTARAMGEI